MKRVQVHIFCRNGVQAAEKVERLRTYCRHRKSRIQLVGETIENSVKMTAFKRLVCNYKQNRTFDLLIVPSISDLAPDLRSVIETLAQVSSQKIRLRFVDHDFDVTLAVGRACNLLVHAQKEWRRAKIRHALEVTAYLNQKYRIGKSLGRPTKITSNVSDLVESKLRAGLSVKEVALEVGLSQTSVKRVRKKMRGSKRG